MLLPRLVVDARRRIRRHWDEILRRQRGRSWRAFHAKQKMKVAMTLLVRDEADIIAATIEHALHIGVDHIIAMDNASVDGTAEILRAYAETGRLEYRQQPETNYRQAVWVTGMARDAAAMGASWIVNLDADEFLWTGDPPRRDSLKALLGGVDPSHGLVGLRQTLFLVDPGIDGGWLEAMTVQRPGWTFNAPLYTWWKVLHRADPDVRVFAGNHLAEGPRIGDASPLHIEIMHFPDRGYAQYARKIDNVGQAVRSGEPLPRSLNLRAWEEYPKLLSGELERIYREREAHTAAQIAAGALKRDTRLRDHLRALLPSALRPDLLRAAIGPS